MERRPTEQAERIEKLKTVFGCRKDIDLARFLDVSSSQITQWGQRGFGRAYEKLVTNLLDSIPCCEISKKQGLAYCGTCGKPLKQKEDR